MSDDFYTKLRAGYYNTSLPYPSKPKEPAVFRKAAVTLTPDELANFGATKTAYDAEVEAHKTAKAAYYADASRLHDEYRKDMAEYNGLTGHPKESKVYDLAWDHGHSSGIAEVANYYSEYADLVK